MLSYRHAFHAGNHADMLKHFIQFLVLDYFNRKDKPYWYIDTHSGAALYDLSSAEAQKVGEYQTGIAPLQAAFHQGNVKHSSLQAFAAHLDAILPHKHSYCGSPWLAQSMLRSDDKYRLFELHPADFTHLQNNMAEARFPRNGIIKQSDGFSSLIALLPPPTRRAVVLIDPPYEQKQDYHRVADTLSAALQRFANGCYLIWYPLLSRPESQALPEVLTRRFGEHYLNATLTVHTPKPDGFGMHGSGMFVINPPYLLADQLTHALPELTHLLQQDQGAHYSLTFHIP